MWDLAIAYMRRAIRVAEQTGDNEWAGADAHLALADIALRAGDSDIAAMAIETARRLDPDASIGRYQRRLRRHLEAPERNPTTDDRARPCQTASSC